MFLLQGPQGQTPLMLCWLPNIYEIVVTKEALLTLLASRPAYVSSDNSTNALQLTLSAATIKLIMYGTYFPAETIHVIQNERYYSNCLLREVDNAAAATDAVLCNSAYTSLTARVVSISLSDRNCSCTRDKACRTNKIQSTRCIRI